MAPLDGKDGKGEAVKTYSYSDLRMHRKPSDGWIAIHGRVYDVSGFIASHPGGDVILSALGRDGTALFEIHHNLVDDLEKVKKTLSKFEIGVLANYKPIANFNTPFSKKLLDACKEAIKGKNRRDSVYSHSATIFWWSCFLCLVYKLFSTSSYIWAAVTGLLIAFGHLQGHAGNHWSLSKYNIINKFMSTFCTSLWGLRERYWEYSHLISHHCYNYTEKDYIMEQHVPLKYFRIRPSDPWKPIHKWQHYIYLTTPFTSFFIGGFRIDCFPFILISPILNVLRRNKDSVLPAPQFFASGSNVSEDKLGSNEDAVGPENFVVFDTFYDNMKSILISNIVWFPLFMHTWASSSWSLNGFIHATLLNYIVFGTQAFLVTRGLLTQHLCEDIILKPVSTDADDWYALQIEASTSIKKNPFSMWLSAAISYQTEHHMFPALNPVRLLDLQPVVQRVAQENNVQYNYLKSDPEAFKSVFAQFKKLSVEPTKKSS